jgi:hypothetical protein
MSLTDAFFAIKESMGFGSRKSGSDNKRRGHNPHSNFEQMHPAVNKDEPGAFANAVEAGAKKFSEEQCGKPMPRPVADDLQPGSDYRCPADVHTREGANPHGIEQMHPAVNKDEPAAFANPCESGAKKPSEFATGRRMPETVTHCQ